LHGSLVLGAAGLLKGYARATALDGDGVSRGVRTIPDQDTRLRRIAIASPAAVSPLESIRADAGALLPIAKPPAIQLRLEYNPAPPFNAGSPIPRAGILAVMRERSRRRRRAAPRRSTAPPARLAELASRRIKISAKEKGRLVSRRPFLFNDSRTLTGDFRTSAPGA